MLAKAYSSKDYESKISQKWEDKNLFKPKEENRKN